MCGLDHTQDSGYNNPLNIPLFGYFLLRLGLVLYQDELISFSFSLQHRLRKIRYIYVQNLKIKKVFICSAINNIIS